MKYKYYAIDFDGTIYDRHLKTILPNAKKVLDKIKKYGGEITIWSCRTGKDAKEARNILDKESVPYDTFNETLPSVRKEWGENGRKIWAEVYIDDLSKHNRKGNVDWNKIEKWIWGDQSND